MPLLRLLLVYSKNPPGHYPVDKCQFWPLFRGRWIQSMHKILRISLHTFSQSPHILPSTSRSPCVLFPSVRLKLYGFCHMYHTWYIISPILSSSIPLVVISAEDYKSWRSLLRVAEGFSLQVLFLLRSNNSSALCFRNTWSIVFPWCTREILTLLIPCTLS